jgi:hypothetical protein
VIQRKARFGGLFLFSAPTLGGGGQERISGRQSGKSTLTVFSCASTSSCEITYRPTLTDNTSSFAHLYALRSGQVVACAQAFQVAKGCAARNTQCNVLRGCCLPHSRRSHI